MILVCNANEKLTLGFYLGGVPVNLPSMKAYLYPNNKLNKGDIATLTNLSKRQVRLFTDSPKVQKDYPDLKIEYRSESDLDKLKEKLS